MKTNLERQLNLKSKKVNGNFNMKTNKNENVRILLSWEISKDMILETRWKGQSKIE